MPTARVNPILKGNEILVMIEKVDASDAYVPYGCVTAANYTNPGGEMEKTACRAGTFVSPSGDPDLPSISLESVIRYVATGDAANNVTDAEIHDYVTNGTKKKVKLLFGSKTGDMVITGPGYFNQQTINGPQTGDATGAVTFSFSEKPTKTASL